MKRAFLLCLILSGCTFSGGIELSDLKGKSMHEVEKSYGEPVVVRHEDEYQMWAYKEGSCHRLIFFDATQTVQFAESRGDCE